MADIPTTAAPPRGVLDVFPARSVISPQSESHSHRTVIGEPVALCGPKPANLTRLYLSTTHCANDRPLHAADILRGWVRLLGIAIRIPPGPALWFYFTLPSCIPSNTTASLESQWSSGSGHRRYTDLTPILDTRPIKHSQTAAASA